MARQRLYSLDPDALSIPWLESPFAGSLVEELELDAEQRSLCRQYRDEGYVVLESGLPAAVFSQIIEGLRDRYRADAALVYSDATRIQDAWQIECPELRAALLSVVNHPRVLDVLRLLYRREPVPFQTLNFPRGTQQATHSDTVHFHAVPQRFMCGAWLALEDISLESGPLHYYPGSHALPVYDVHDLGYAGSLVESPEERQALMKEYERFVQALVSARGLKRRTFCARRGQILIWAANLLHGGEPIADASLSRHSMVTHYYFESSLYYTPFASDAAVGRYALRDVINLRTGQPEPQRYLELPVQCVERGPLRTRALVELPAARPQLTMRAPLRLLAWPRYRDPGALREWALRWLRALAPRADVCVCLRHDAGRDELSLETLLGALQRELRACAEPIRCELLIVNDPLDEERWRALRRDLTACLATGADATRRARLAALGLPLLEAPEQLPLPLV
jgi:hypothetical protein